MCNYSVTMVEKPQNYHKINFMLLFYVIPLQQEGT